MSGSRDHGRINQIVVKAPRETPSSRAPYNFPAND